MRLSPLFLSLVAVMAIGCDKPMPLDPTDNPFVPSVPGNPSNPGSSDPGEISDPDGPPAPPPIVTVDPSVFGVSLSGSFTSSGTTTGVLFLTSGPAMWNQGTCSGDVALGTDGTWVSAAGVPGAAHDSRCISYWSDGRAGVNNKGTCTVTPRGFIGLWRNPGGHATSPYHAKCLSRGTVSSTLVLSFTQQAKLYTANDGSQRKVLDFIAAGTVTGQLVYTGSALGYTTGTGVMTATDGGGGAWTMSLSQAAFHWYTGAVNGDLISMMQPDGVEAIACNTAVGCVAATVKVGA